MTPFDLLNPHLNEELEAARLDRQIQSVLRSRLNIELTTYRGQLKASQAAELEGTRKNNSTLSKGILSYVEQAAKKAPKGTFVQDPKNLIIVDVTDKEANRIFEGNSYAVWDDHSKEYKTPENIFNVAYNVITYEGGPISGPIRTALGLPRIVGRIDVCAGRGYDGAAKKEYIARIAIKTKENKELRPTVFYDRSDKFYDIPSVDSPVKTDQKEFGTQIGKIISGALNSEILPLRHDQTAKPKPLTP